MSKIVKKNKAAMSLCRSPPLSLSKNLSIDSLDKVPTESEIKFPSLCLTPKKPLGTLRTSK